jgi:RNA polymerase sigma-70 factor (ECF subfamily)
MLVSLSEFEGVLPYTDSLEERVEVGELSRIISAYLDAVSDRRMYIFLRRFFYVMPIAEIARKLGCSQSTVHKELAAMKQELRQKLRQEGYEL